MTTWVPIVSAALILLVAAGISHVMMSTVSREQELGVRRLAAVYLDGIATTVYPHVVAHNLADTDESLSRSMWFHQDMQEQRALVVTPDGSLFADVSGPGGHASFDDPFHDHQLRERLMQEAGLIFNVNTGMGWASRSIVHNGTHVADLYVALNLKPLVKERQSLRRNLLLATILASVAAGIAGFLLMRWMVAPVRLVTERLRRAQEGDFEPVPFSSLPPAASEYGRLLRGYNSLVGALREREALAARLAEQERESVLGRLAATVAHEVRNPLGGMSTALDTIRKFGENPEVRRKCLDLIERGLWSIRDVVSSVLAFHRMPRDPRSLTSGDLDDLRILIEPEVSRRDLALLWRSEIEETVDVPATEVRQIALNLLLNACEASPTGTQVTFRAWVSRSPDSLGGAELIMEVVDAGAGLPPAAAATLMEIGTADRRDPLRGLGIRVVRDLVRGLGGRIVATTIRNDQGSQIVVNLPISQEVREAIAT